MMEPTSDVFNEQVCHNVSTSLKQLQRDVEVLKEWITKQPHLPQCSNDILLGHFLLSSKNSMERAKEKINNYYTSRLLMRSFFANRDPENPRYRSITEEVRLFPLRQFTTDGCCVTMGSLISGDVRQFDFQTFGTHVMALSDIMFTTIPFAMGTYIVADMALFSVSHLVRITPTAIRDFINCIQDVLPMTLKAFILFNCPPAVEFLVKLGEPFMKTKLFKRLHTHSEDHEILTKYFSKDMLPQEYGGKADSIKKLNDETQRIILEKRNWLMNEGSATVDETKRMRETGPNKGMENMQGSFRTLSVD